MAGAPGASAAATASGSGCRRAATRSTSRSCRRWPPARPTCRSTPTTPHERAELVFGEAGVVGDHHRRRPDPRRRARRAGGAPRRRWAATTPGSSSPPARPAPRRASPSPTATRRRSSTPRRGSSCRTTRSGPATGCSPGCRWRSTPPARRCGWRGGTARAWCPRRGRWCAAAWTSGPWLVVPRRHRGLDGARRWRRCGPPRRSSRSGC